MDVRKVVCIWRKCIMGRIFFSLNGYPLETKAVVKDPKLEHQHLYNFGLRGLFYQGMNSHKSNKIVQTRNFSTRLFPYPKLKISLTSPAGDGMNGNPKTLCQQARSKLKQFSKPNLLTWGDGQGPTHYLSYTKTSQTKCHKQSGTGFQVSF